jgi:hypothetical protein
LTGAPLRPTPVAVTTTGTNGACGPGVTLGAPDATACIGVDGRGPVDGVVLQLASPTVRSAAAMRATIYRAGLRSSDPARTPCHTSVLVPSSARPECQQPTRCIPRAKDPTARPSKHVAATLGARRVVTTPAARRPEAAGARCDPPMRSRTISSCFVSSASALLNTRPPLRPPRRFGLSLVPPGPPR